MDNVSLEGFVRLLMRAAGKGDWYGSTALVGFQFGGDCFCVGWVLGCF